MQTILNENLNETKKEKEKKKKKKVTNHRYDTHRYFVSEKWIMYVHCLWGIINSVS